MMQQVNSICELLLVFNSDYASCTDEKNLNFSYPFNAITDADSLDFTMLFGLWMIISHVCKKKCGDKFSHRDTVHEWQTDRQMER